MRRDDPDVRRDVAILVARELPSEVVQRAEERHLEHERLIGQPTLDGSGGWLHAELVGTSFTTVWGAIDHAAGPPSNVEAGKCQRAAGLVAIASAWNRDPVHGTARADVTVVIDLADASQNAFATVIRRQHGHAPRLSARAAEVVGCDGDLSMLVTDRGQPLLHLRAADHLPQRLRTAVLLRDRGCRWPGCSAPPWMRDVHHLRHRADGGDHAVTNLATQCRRHHRRLHGPWWEARMGVDATFELRRPGADAPTHVTRPTMAITAGRPPPDVP